MKRPLFRASDVIANIVLLIGAGIMLLPLVWMLLTSLKTPAEIFGANLSFLPSRFDFWDNYAEAFSAIPLLRFMINGVVVVTAILVLQVLIAAPCGYALAKLNFPGQPILFGAVLLALLIPIQIPALPIYLALAQMRLLDSYTALIAPWVISAFAIFLFRQFFKAFPDEVIEAARLDGFSEFAIVWRIVLPSAWPAVAAFAIFSVVSHWNDLYWPFVVVASPEMMTPPQGVAFFRMAGDSGGNVGALMAASVVVTTPMIIAFLSAQRQFMSGLSLAGQH